MSLNDPLDPDANEPDRPLPEFPPPPPPSTSGARRGQSVLAQAASLPPWMWLGLGVIATLLVIIAIIATTTLVRTLATPASVPTPTATRIVPALSIVPGTAVPGQLVAVSGINLTPNDPVTIFLRDPGRPGDPILQVNKATVNANGLLSSEFVYPREARWTTLLHADVIVQSVSTGAYWTASVAVQPVAIGTPLPLATSTPPLFATWTPVPFATWTPAPFATWTPMPFATWTPLPGTLAPPASTSTPVVVPTVTPPPTVKPPPTVAPPPVVTDWRGEYFDNPTLTGAPVLVRNDFDVKFNWGRGAPDPRVPADYFSARWTRTLGFENKIYRFSVQCDDGVRVWVDNNLIIDEWHAAAPQVHSRDVSLSAGLHAVRIEYYEGVLDAYIFLKIEPVDKFNGWKGEYFDNPFLSGDPKLIRDDAAVAFDWGANPPVSGLPAQRWSARWTRTAELAGGVYRFTLRADDGVRLLIDDTLIINEWHAANGQIYVRDVNLLAGAHKLVVEYYQDLGGAFVWLTYQPPPIEISRWRSEFYANDRWAGFPTAIRSDDRIDFDWGQGAPEPLIPVDRFSARFTRIFELSAGEYQFDILVDDGVRFYVDGLLLIDQIKEQAAAPYSVRTTLPQGNHEMRIDYVDYTGQARLAWSRTFLSATSTPSPTPTITPTPPSNLPVINQFTVAPNPVVAGACVSLNWQAGGGAIIARLLRDGAVFQDNVPLTGSTADCPSTPGTITYRLEAYNSVNQSVARDVAVTVQAAMPSASPAPSATPGVPTINSFTASAASIVLGQPVTLTWSTSNVTTHLDLFLNGQLISPNLPASASAQHSPAGVGTQQYQLVIAALSGGTPITATVTVEVTSP